MAQVSAAEKHIVALDLDGTVLNNHFHEDVAEGRSHEPDYFDPEVGEAIRALYKAGHEVVISTGRSVDATLPVVEALKIQPEWVICANGAVTLKRDPLAHRAYRREYVEAFDPSEALQRIRTHLVTARFAVELAEGGFLYTEEIPTGTLPSARRQVTFEELLGVQATRVVVVSPDHHLEDFIEIASTMDLSNVSYSIGYTTWLDLAPVGVTKASALEVVAAQLGIGRSRVFAAGDGYNDIDMLQWAGRHGDAVAMGQAADAVKAVASRVTGRVSEAGLLTALCERFPEVL